MEFNFINPDHITTKFDTVVFVYFKFFSHNYLVIMGEEFEINMFGKVSNLPWVHHKPSLHHQLPASSSHKNSRDETTGYRDDNATTTAVALTGQQCNSNHSSHRM